MRFKHCKWLGAVVLGAVSLAGAGTASAQSLPVMEAVVGNNFGHLPMFVGVEKGFFKKHGLDLKLKVVNIGTQMVTSMQKNEVQIGDMSVTTFLKARHAGDPFRVIGVIQSDATRARGLGAMERGRWETLGKQLVDLGIVERAPRVELFE